MNVLSSEGTEMNGSKGLKVLTRSGRLIYYETIMNMGEDRQEESDQ